MKKHLICAAIVTAIILIVSCRGSNPAEGEGEDEIETEKEPVSYDIRYEITGSLAGREWAKVMYSNTDKNDIVITTEETIYHSDLPFIAETVMQSGTKAVIQCYTSKMMTYPAAPDIEAHIYANEVTAGADVPCATYNECVRKEYMLP